MTGTLDWSKLTDEQLRQLGANDPELVRLIRERERAPSLGLPTGSLTMRIEARIVAGCERLGLLK